MIKPCVQTEHVACILGHRVGWIYQAEYHVHVVDVVEQLVQYTAISHRSPFTSPKKHKEEAQRTQLSSTVSFFTENPLWCDCSQLMVVYTRAN